MRLCIQPLPPAFKFIGVLNLPAHNNMPPKEYDLKGITLGFSGSATTLAANEIVNGGFWPDLDVRHLAFSCVYLRCRNIG
ncbi:hypothetical protein EMIT0P253_270040 [Pseudomonas sp. IT-P253]